MALQPGVRFAERFEIVAYLGSGGVSSVYHAKDRPARRDVALKLLHRHLTEAADRMRREIEITRTVSHPNIADYYDIVEADGEVALVLEYLPGGDLKHLILSRGALPESEAVRVVSEALSGLEAAHEAGVIHCDIKPHNMLLDSEGHVRLTDFGLARTGARMVSADGDRGGTPDYAAPEVTTLGYSDARSDLYAIGITLFEALAGRLPYQANSVQAILYKHANEQIPSIRDLVPDVSDSVDAVLRRAMAKDPAERFQTAAEFRRALDSMSLPVKPPTETVHRCPVCGGEVLDAFPLCLACGRIETALVRSPSRSGGYRIVVVGPGKPGDRLDPELRHRILGFLASAHGGSPSMEKRIPRLPFVLFGGLTRDSALATASLLEELGLEVLVGGKTEIEGKKRITRLLNRKSLALFPRIMLIGFGSFAGVFPSIGQSAPGVAFAILGFMMLGVPIAVRISSGSPKAKSAGSPAETATAALLPITARVSQPAVRRLVARIAARVDSLSRGSSDERNTENTEGVAPGVAAAALEVIPRLTQLVSDIVELEQSLRAIDHDDPSGPGRDAPREALHGASTGDPSRGSDAETVRRRLEGTMQLCIDRLLRFSVLLDRIAVALASAGSSRGDTLVSQFGEAAVLLEIDATALSEVDS